MNVPRRGGCALALGLADVERWTAWEGLTWVPADAPRHPDTIAALGCRDDLRSHLFFIRLDGTIEAEVISEPDGVIGQYLCGIGYDAGHQRFLVTGCQSDGYAMGLDGQLLDGGAPVASTAGVEGLEGVVVDARGNVLRPAATRGGSSPSGPARIASGSRSARSGSAWASPPGPSRGIAPAASS